MFIGRSRYDEYLQFCIGESAQNLAEDWIETQHKRGAIYIDETFTVAYPISDVSKFTFDTEDYYVDV